MNTSELDALIQRVVKTQHGFGDIKRAAQETISFSARMRQAHRQASNFCA